MYIVYGKIEPKIRFAERMTTKMKTKRLSAIIITLLMILSLMPSNIAFADTGIFAGGMGTKDDPYTIATAEQLKNFRDSVSEENTYCDKYIKLTADINLNGSETNQWTPIGDFSDSSNNVFAGNFNGDRHTIKGLYINNTSDHCGLFGCVSPDGRIENLSVEGVITAGRCSGGIAGWNEGTIYGCSSNIKITGAATIEEASEIGGIVGSNEGGTVENCYNKGDVTADGTVGGIVGYGLRCTVTGCHNTGNVEGKDSVGGIVGYASADQSTDTELKITNCSNSGYIKGGNYIGGVVGFDYYITIENCYNLNDVTGKNATGGVVGRSVNTLKNCYNLGNVTGDEKTGGVAGDSYESLKNCYNMGNVFGNHLFGGVTGSTWNTVEDCFYLDTCNGSAENFDCLKGSPLTAAEMKTGDNFTNWDFVDTWVMGTFSPMLKSNPEIKTKNTADVTISSAEEFLDFKNDVNSGAFIGYAVLLCDIDLKCDNKNQHTPIGNNTYYFEGTFDGDGHTVSGLYIDNSELTALGLFGVAGENAIIKNINTEGSIAAKSKCNGVGGIAGVNKGTIINCTSGVGINGKCCLGGIAGYNRETGTIQNCQNVGYVAGFTDDDGENEFVGGIVGKNNGVANGCGNTGNVSGNEEVGGVAGENKGNVTKCRNTGDVSGNQDIGGVIGCNFGTIELSYNAGDVDGKNYVGGVEGSTVYDDYSGYEGSLTNCYNTGSVSGKESVGGIVGSLSDDASITNSYNTGTVVGTMNAGGVAGTKYGTEKNCFYLADCKGNGTNFDCDAGTALSSEQMKTQDEYVGWDFDGIWTMGNFSPMLVSNIETETINSADAIIYTADDLKQLSDDVSSDTNDYEYKYIYLANDIDLQGNSNNQWTPIGNPVISFKGTFDGNGHTVKGLYIDEDNLQINPELLGMFGVVHKNGTVKNLSVEGKIDGLCYLGGIAGKNYGTIINCSSSVEITGTEIVGGIVGYNHGGKIEKSRNTGDLSVNYYAGGICGCNYGSNSSVENCYNVGKVESENTFGGIVGNNEGGKVTNCYNVGSVYVYYYNNCGGVVGSNNVGNENEGTVTNCYYLADCNVGGEFDSDEGTALTADEMKNAQNFTGWDFENVWIMKDRPLLMAEPNAKIMEILSVSESDGKTTAVVFAPVEGEYKLVFADYENGKLNLSDVADFEVSKIGIVNVISKADVSLGVGDKVMILNNFDDVTPACKAYEIK